MSKRRPYQDTWNVGGAHPHVAIRRDFSVRHATPPPPASEVALAAQADGPPVGSPDHPAAIEARASADIANDPVLQGMIAQRDVIQRRLAEEQSTGFGDKSKKAADALAAANEQIAAYQKQKADDAVRASADAYAKSPIGMAVAVAKEYGPYVAGAVAGLLLSRGLTKKLAAGATKNVARFEAIAKEVASIDKATNGKNIVGSSKGDRMAALLREAFRTGGVKKPLKVRSLLAPTSLSHRADEAKLFKPDGHGDNVIAGTLIAEGAITRYVAPEFTTDDNQKALLQNIGMSSMAAGLAFKTGRKIASKNPALKPSHTSIVAVTASRDRLARELSRNARGAGLVEEKLERDAAIAKAMKPYKAKGHAPAQAKVLAIRDVKNNSSR